MKRLMLTGLLLAGTPAMAVDPCLLGTWQADTASMAADMATLMSGQMGIAVSASHAGGEISMEINEAGFVTMLVDNLQIAVTPVGVPEMLVTVTGFSEALITAEDGATYDTTAVDYNLLGSADVMGQTMEIPFDASTGMGGASAGGYRCAGDGLQFSPEPAGTMPAAWTRLP
jgi:hypothetical protein